jgi:hypothetical protein
MSPDMSPKVQAVFADPAESVSAPLTDLLRGAMTWHLRSATSL